MELFVLILPNKNTLFGYADLKSIQNILFEFPVLNVVAVCIISCGVYFVIKRLVFLFNPDKYLEYSELVVSLCALFGMIILGVVIVLYVVVSPELLEMLLRIRFFIKVVGFIGAGASLCLTGVMIKIKGGQHYMYHLFFDERIDGLERPYKRSCIIVLIVIALIMQETLCRYSAYTEYESMVIVIGLLNMVLGVLYFYIKQNFTLFFGTPSDVLEVLKTNKEVPLSLLPERNLEVAKLPIQKKSKVYSYNSLLGNPLLKSRGINSLKICCTHKRGMETTSANESASKLGEMWSMNVYSDRYLGGTEEVLGGLERKMLIRTGNVLQPLSFMDGPTKANMAFRVCEMEARRDTLEREPRIRGAPE